MIPFVLPNVLLIAESCTSEEYNELIFPKLKPVLKIQDPIQVPIKTPFNEISAIKILQSNIMNYRLDLLNDPH